MKNFRLGLKDNLNAFIVKKDKVISYEITTDENKFYTLKKKSILRMN